MKNKFRNYFLLFGLFSIFVMLGTLEMDYSNIRQSIIRLGMWFPVIVLLWSFIYLLNAWAWYLIIHDEKKNMVSLGRIYKYSITGFSLNYITPCGLMGGEPYRIMELTPLLGVSKATSSVILYVMMHIFSHFWFWLFSVFLYVIMYPIHFYIGFLLTIIGFSCLFAIYFFSIGYRRGMTLRCLIILGKVPFVKKWALKFLKEKRDVLIQIDSQITLLHNQHKKTFYSSLCLEFLARIFSSLEIYLILYAFSEKITFGDSILILAFSSLFSNLLFFSPMQIGSREGGLALAVNSIHISGILGVYTGLITRVRELIWIIIGLVLIKIGGNNNKIIVKQWES